jgi:3'-phosphoadenosine 5'-phosphosulfate sulfotransferase (PAPS reductase)/FAD synthetase
MESNKGVLSAARIARVEMLTREAFSLIGEAKDLYVGDREIVATCILYSGGNDSTTLAHLFRDFATHAVHINTGIGIEKTRQFVRDTCESWGLPLIEKHPPAGSTYRELVLAQGFPGPAMHFKMYQRLKERGLMAVRRDFVTKPRQQRIVYLAGRRREESTRRANIVEHEKVGSIVFVSPLVNWTKEDLNTYRALHQVPRNEVSDLLHMSGECLCGAFAHKGELDEIAIWFPGVAAEIRQLEKEVAAAGQKHCVWGWGADRKIEKTKVGTLCSSCDFRRNEALEG